MSVILRVFYWSADAVLNFLYLGHSSYIGLTWKNDEHGVEYGSN